MFVTNHVLLGALLGAACPAPATAFAVGAASHFALDATPHWGRAPQTDFVQVARRDGLIGLAALAGIAVVARGPVRGRMLAGATGAALPDLDKPGEHFFGRSPFPAAVDRFHASIQDEAPQRLGYELAVGALAAVAVAVTARSSRTTGRGARAVREGGQAKNSSRASAVVPGSSSGR